MGIYFGPSSTGSDSSPEKRRYLSLFESVSFSWVGQVFQGWKTCIYYIYLHVHWVWDSPSSTDHQDYYWLVGDSCRPSFGMESWEGATPKYLANHFMDSCSSWQLALMECSFRWMPVMKPQTVSQNPQFSHFYVIRMYSAVSKHIYLSCIIGICLSFVLRLEPSKRRPFPIKTRFIWVIPRPMIFNTSIR